MPRLADELYALAVDCSVPGSRIQVFRLLELREQAEAMEAVLVRLVTVRDEVGDNEANWDAARKLLDMPKPTQLAESEDSCPPEY